MMFVVDNGFTKMVHRLEDQRNDITAAESK